MQHNHEPQLRRVAPGISNIKTDVITQLRISPCSYKWTIFSFYLCKIVNCKSTFMEQCTLNLKDRDGSLFITLFYLHVLISNTILVFNFCIYYLCNSDLMLAIYFPYNSKIVDRIVVTTLHNFEKNLYLDTFSKWITNLNWTHSSNLYNLKSTQDIKATKDSQYN